MRKSLPKNGRNVTAPTTAKDNYNVLVRIATADRAIAIASHKAATPATKRAGRS